MWPWDWIYTTARTCLGWSELEFWESTPRKFYACYEAWKEIEIDRECLHAYIVHGGYKGNPDKLRPVQIVDAAGGNFF